MRNYSKSRNTTHYTNRIAIDKVIALRKAGNSGHQLGGLGTCCKPVDIIRLLWISGHSLSTENGSTITVLGFPVSGLPQQLPCCLPRAVKTLSAPANIIKFPILSDALLNESQRTKSCEPWVWNTDSVISPGNLLSSCNQFRLHAVGAPGLSQGCMLNSTQLWNYFRCSHGNLVWFRQPWLLSF